MNEFFVYILKCQDDSFYVGHTDNLDKRLAEHNDGKFCGYTSQRLPVVCVFSETFATRDEAFLVERKIKGWTRKKKMALIDRDWQVLSELSRKSFE